MSTLVCTHANASRYVREAVLVLLNRQAEIEHMTLDDGELAPPEAWVLLDLPDKVRQPNRHLRVNARDLREMAPEWARSDGSTFIVGVAKNTDRSDTFVQAVLDVADHLEVSYTPLEGDRPTTNRPSRNHYSTLGVGYARRLYLFGTEDC